MRSLTPKPPKQARPESRAAEESPRLANGRFPRGVSGNPGGLPKGLAEVRELARAHTALAIDTLVKIADRGKNEMAKIAASNSLLDRGWGKPTQPISGDEDMPPVAMSVEDKQRDLEARQAAAKALLDEAFGEDRPRYQVPAKP